MGRATRGRRREFRGPLVSVVLAVSDDESPRIDPLLDGLREQSHRNLEVLVVPFGTTSVVGDIVRRHAAEDWRIRVLPPATDRAAARNAGARRARGHYLAFVSGGDDVPRTGVTAAVTTLERTGSDLAVGKLGQVSSASVLADRSGSLAERAHRRLVVGTTLESTPEAVNDLALGNRLFRRDFWRRAGLKFTQDARHDGELALSAYLAADSFDVLDRVTYVPTGRVAGSSVGSMQSAMPRLPDWLEDTESTLDRIAVAATPEVRDQWLAGVLDVSVQPFLDDVERATEEDFEHLHRLVARVRDIAGQSAWSRVRATSRVKLALLTGGRRAELESYVEQRWFERDDRPTRLVHGEVVACLPFLGDAEVGVPDEAYVMGEAETPLVLILRRASWRGDRLVLDLLGRIDFVDLAQTPRLDVELVRSDTGDRTPLEVAQRTDPSANEVDGRRYQDFAPGTFRVTVDAAAVARSAGDADGLIWFDLAATLTVPDAGGDLVRHGGITRIDDRGEAGLLGLGQTAPRLWSGRRVGLVRRSEFPETRGAGLATVVAVPDAGLSLTDARVSGRTLTGTVDVGTSGVTRLRLSGGGRSSTVPLSGSGRARSFRVSVPQPDRGQWQWSLTGVPAGADAERDIALSWPEPPDSEGREEWLASTGDLVVARGGRGGTSLVESRATLVVLGADLGDEEAVLRCRWLGTPDPDASVDLVGRAATVSGSVTSQEDGTATVRFRLRWDPWRLGEVPVPTGRYDVRLRDVSGRDGRVLHSVATVDSLYDVTDGEVYRARLVRTRGREAGLGLLPPLAAADRGPLAQRRLQQQVLSATTPIDPRLVYLQAYQGQSATDSQLAIHHELRRTHPELSLVWGIADRAQTVPEGARGVVLHSREWYDALGTAGHLVMNVDFERWFTPRPGQRVLQTFHGYPAKSMGIAMWEGKGYTPRRIAAELARTSGDWDLILTPSPEMDVHYRTQYRYEGEIHSLGYPRADALVAPGHVERRAEVRRRLGIAPDQVAVLYAPTWRDDSATRWLSAEMVTHLDLDKAGAALGEGYVVLMRGHRFHGRATRPAGSARLLDVTTYPEINDLILAADVAVLDYSSLRFDFALTGRPMVFLVPDLEDYTGGVRGFLFDFADTAPGPLVATTGEVVSALRDLPALERRFGPSLEDFNRRYNAWMDGHAAERVVAAFFGPSSPETSEQADYDAGQAQRPTTSDEGEA